MRIALWNGSSLNNVGDRLIDAVTRRELNNRLPRSEFQTFSPWPGAFPSHLLRIDTNGRWNGQGEFDAIVIGGGALITGPPFSDPSAQFFLLGPYPERFQDTALIVWNSICSDVQSLAATQERWRTFVRSAVSRVSFLTVRNWRTYSFLRACGVTEPIDVVPDVAVLATKPTLRSPSASRPRIGIAPGRPVFPDEFLEMMAINALANSEAVNPEVVRMKQYSEGDRFDEAHYAMTLADQVREIVGVDFLVFGFGAMYGDQSTAILLAQRLDGAQYVPLAEPLGEDVVSLIRSLDCIVAFRLHACILALAVGTPFIAIDAYRNKDLGTSKLYEFMKDTGFESNYLTTEELLLDGRHFRTLVEQALDKGSEPVVCAHRRLAARAQEHFDALAEMIATRMLSSEHIS